MVGVRGTRGALQSDGTAAMTSTQLPSPARVLLAQGV